jgi:hypothetical protein
MDIKSKHASLNYKKTIIISIFLLILLSIVYANNLPGTVRPGAPFPAKYDFARMINNFTVNDTSPISLSRLRGYIYEMNIGVNQNTHRWIGYVGNITGNITLRDNLGNQLYAWQMIITSGEIYATRFNGGSAGLDTGGNRNTSFTGNIIYDYVDWTNVSCASRNYINLENAYLKHDITVDNDALGNTFVNTSSFKSNGYDFEVADRYIDIDNDISGGCSGTFLFNSTGRQNKKWQMVVLEDGGRDGMKGDIVFAALVENNAKGFNGKTYDFQILLPETGDVLTGVGNARDNNIQPSLTYYFYVELIGEGWNS